MNFDPETRPRFSKRALRRVAHTSQLRRVIEKHRDKRDRVVIRARLDMRYTDRSKYPKKIGEEALESEL